MIGRNCIEFKKEMFSSYFIYVVGEEIVDKRINNLSIVRCDKLYKVCLCKVKKKDFKWFSNIMEECYEKFKEDKEYTRYCRELLSMVSYEGGV